MQLLLYLNVILLLNVLVVVGSDCTNEHVKNISSRQVILERREAIREAFGHAFYGYKNFAGFAFDELKPVSRTPYQWMNLSLSVFSSLDTLWLMGFMSEFKECLQFISSFNFDRDLDVSLFESNIRIVGGLLGAYELSKEPNLLNTASRLADRLLFAFNTTSGIPFPSINLKTHHGKSTWGSPSSQITTLAEIGSLQLEFTYLSHHTKNPIYQQKAQKGKKQSNFILFISINSLVIFLFRKTDSFTPSPFDISQISNFFSQSSSFDCFDT